MRHLAVYPTRNLPSGCRDTSPPPTVARSTYLPVRLPVRLAIRARDRIFTAVARRSPTREREDEADNGEPIRARNHGGVGCVLISPRSTEDSDRDDIVRRAEFLEEVLDDNLMPLFNDDFPPRGTDRLADVKTINT